jgi:peptidoglycan-associated lipoprotein
MKNERVWTSLCALLGTVLGACAHQQAVDDTTTSSNAAPRTPVSRNATPSTDQPSSDRSQSEEQDVTALLQGTVLRFDFDRALLTAESETRLQKIADVLRTHRAVEIKISGHCDERGTEEYNLALGQQRAGAAKKYLVGLGIQSNRIDIISYGKERPLDPRHTEEAWAANRRDEFAPSRF